MEKNYLNNAIRLYQDDSITVKKIKVDYILSDDTQEKKCLKLALINEKIK